MAMLIDIHGEFDCGTVFWNLKDQCLILCNAENFLDQQFTKFSFHRIPLFSSTEHVLVLCLHYLDSFQFPSLLCTGPSFRYVCLLWI